MCHLSQPCGVIKVSALDKGHAHYADQCKGDTRAKSTNATTDVAVSNQAISTDVGVSSVLVSTPATSASDGHSKIKELAVPTTRYHGKKPNNTLMSDIEAKIADLRNSLAKSPGIPSSNTSLAPLSTEKEIKDLFRPHPSSVPKQDQFAGGSTVSNVTQLGSHLDIDASDKGDASPTMTQYIPVKKASHRSSAPPTSGATSRSPEMVDSSDDSLDSTDASSDEADYSDAASSPRISHSYNFNFIAGSDDEANDVVDAGAETGAAAAGTSETSSESPGEDEETKSLDGSGSPLEPPSPSLESSDFRSHTPPSVVKLARLETPTYINELLEQPNQTTASIRLLRIMMDEQVKLDSSLGLKLLDLVQAMKRGGELSPIDVEIPVPKAATPIIADTGHLAKLQIAAYNKTSDRLNEFAGMLNAIAEAVGVNLREDGEREGDSDNQVISSESEVEHKEAAKTHLTSTHCESSQRDGDSIDRANGDRNAVEKSVSEQPREPLSHETPSRRQVPLNKELPATEKFRA